MPTAQGKEDVSIEFIRLLFISPVEEEVAHRWASRLSKVVGPWVMQLRPETTLSQMLEWATLAGADSIDFLMVFEPELRIEFADFLADADHYTFREMVEHYASRFRNCA